VLHGDVPEYTGGAAGRRIARDRNVARRPAVISGMSHTCRLTVLICFALALPLAAAEKPAVDANPPAGAKLDDKGKPLGDGWVALIGKDLAGWKAEPEYWKLEGDVLHGLTPGHPKHHYAYTEKQYGDFELHADVKLIGNNSGICIRIAPTDFDNVPGYQVDMGDGYWGCLWDERGKGMLGKCPKDKADQIVKKEDWNHYYVRAEGKRVQVWLNGVKTVDVTDEKARPAGPIGFQLCHGNKKTDASFKNVYVKPLGQ
jgi:hypothetical protein